MGSGAQTPEQDDEYADVRTEVDWVGATGEELAAPARAGSEGLDEAWDTEITSDELEPLDATDDVSGATDREPDSVGEPAGMATALSGPGAESLDGGETEFEDLDVDEQIAEFEAEMQETTASKGGRLIWFSVLAAGLLVALSLGGMRFLKQLTPLAGPTVAEAPVRTRAEPPAPEPAVADPGLPEPVPVESAVEVEPAGAEPSPVPEPMPADPEPVLAEDPVGVPDAGPPAAAPDLAELFRELVSSGSQGAPSLITPEDPGVRVPVSETPTTPTSSQENVLLRRGETIVELPNGHFFKGRIKRLKNDRLTLASGGAEYTFAMSDLVILDDADPEYRSPSELPKAAVTLQNGQRLRGRLLRETDDYVVLAYQNGRLMVPRADVSSVSLAGRVRF